MISITPEQRMGCIFFEPLTNPSRGSPLGIFPDVFASAEVEISIDASRDHILNAHMSMVSRSAFVFIALVVINLPKTAVGQQLVTIDSSGFNPGSLTIGVGDSVLWYNLDMAGPHTTTSDLPPGNPDYWNVTLSPSTFYTRTFVHAGTFGYHDNLSGFTGTIIVTAPRLDAPRMVNGQFVFDATGLTVGRTNFLQSSTNLATWTTIRTNKAASSSMTFSNTVGAGHSFYRLIEIR